MAHFFGGPPSLFGVAQRFIELPALRKRGSEDPARHDRRVTGQAEALAT